MSAEDILNPRKLAMTFPISRELAIEYGLIEPTPEERAKAEASHARWREWRTRQDAVEARMDAALGALTDPVARLVLDLHSHGDGDECRGCDPGWGAEDRAEWPCATIEAIAEHYGIQTSEPYPLEDA